MSDAVLEKLEEMDQRLQQIEKVVKGGNQPEKQIKVESNGGPGSTAVARIMKEARAGGKFDGVNSGRVQTILSDEGHGRSRQAVLNLMQRIGDKFPAYKYRKGNSTRGSEVQFHPEDRVSDEKATLETHGGSE